MLDACLTSRNLAHFGAGISTSLTYVRQWRSVCLSVKLTFVETPVFTDLIAGLLADAYYLRLQEYLLICPTAGDMIVGTAGCRKLRWRVSGRKGGKSGGMRVIYYYRSAHDQIIFLLAYDHRAVDDLSSAQKRRLASIVRQLK